MMLLRSSGHTVRGNSAPRAFARASVACGLAALLLPASVHASLLANPARPGPLTHPANPDTAPATEPARPTKPTTPTKPTPPTPAPTPSPAPASPASPAFNPNAAAEAAKAEAPYLSGYVQLTFPAQFSKAGEAYFEPGATPKWIIFQAVPADGSETNYQMYVAKLARDASGTITGLDASFAPQRLSPSKSSSTCGWFHPTEPGRVIFGSTVIEPNDDQAPGFSRDRQSYQWKFPAEMRIVSRTVEAIVKDKLPADEATKVLAARKDVAAPADFFTLPNGPGYAAECSVSPDGRFVLYTYRDPKTSNPDIWVLDTRTGKHTALVTVKGYNGGPFFSPDAKQIVYRSDRKGDSNLQLFAADLAVDAATGAITGITREVQLTDDSNVNWTPYYHPSGQYLVFASSKAGHRNYEVFAIDAKGETPAAERAWARVTTCDGFDGLPVFDATGTLLMWTSQRGKMVAGQERPSSQIWIATVTGKPAFERRALPAGQVK